MPATCRDTLQQAGVALSLAPGVGGVPVGQATFYAHFRKPLDHRGDRRQDRDSRLINLQEGSAGKAKPYQVRQVLAIVDTYGLEVEP